MKLNGKKLEGVPQEIVVFPRQDGDIVFTVQAVLDYEDCNKLDPKPDPPMKLLPGNIRQQNVEDPSYREKLDKWAARRSQYMIWKSLDATDGLEWELVAADDPSTWDKVEEELMNAGFAAGEIAYLTNKIFAVNGLDEEKIEQATKSFLAGQVEAQENS